MDIILEAKGVGVAVTKMRGLLKNRKGGGLNRDENREGCQKA